ncbi:MAG: FAD-dependent oxidoreductase [Mycobacterium sp.]
MTVSRRLFLGLSGLAGIAALSACGGRDTADGGQSSSRTDGSDADVIVIGAGISGLAAARHLADHGQSVVILEARNRIGGRIWTSTTWAGAPMDLGASWIHGIDGNPIYQLAQQAGVKTVVTDGDSITYHLPGGQETTDQQSRRLERWGAKAADAVTRYQDEQDIDTSIRAAVRNSVDTGALSSLDSAFLSYNLNEYEQEYSGSIDELSALYFDSDAPIEGDDVLFPGGYGQLTDRLATGLRTLLEHTVTRVDWTRDGVTVTTDKGVFAAGRVIVTLPLGVLQSGSVTFSPGLPAHKADAIRALGYGVLNKCYLRFPRAFWVDTDWIGYVPPTDRYGQWAQWINVARPTGLPILLGFNAADFGRAIEKWSDTTIVDSAMATLQTVYGPTIPNPVDFQITRWVSDAYARGSYSYNKVGSTPAMRDDLATTVDGRVYFAGEATHRQSFATVHGAYESGLRAARDIVEHG